MKQITPKIKDDVLNCLCTEIMPESMYNLNPKVLCDVAGIDFETLNAVLKYFQRIGFVDELNSKRDAIFLILQVEATDYWVRGGFVAQEELIEHNIQKLFLEIENLNKQLGPTHLETINKLSAIGSAIISGITFFKK